MENVPFPEDLRRFVLTSIPSVPFLEALLLLRANPTQQWQPATLAGRLYVRERTAEALLEELARAGMAAHCDALRGEAHLDCYEYRPSSPQLRARIDALADLYARHLVEVTVLIHSSLDRKAQQFVDAFKLRKDS